MRYLLELNEFDSENRIDQICKRIENTGYISRSTEKELGELTGIHDIVDQIYRKVDEIYSFYNRFSKDYIDDILLEFFKSSQYTYKINIGVFLPKKHYYLYVHGDIDTNFLFGDNYDNANDKQQYLLSSLLSFVKKINKESHRLADKQREERKNNNKFWISQPRSRKVHVTNYFKYFLLMKPLVNIDIYHREYATYWENDTEYCLTMDGWNQKQFSANWVDDSISNRIKRRFSYIHPCSVESAYHDSYTYRQWYDGEIEDEDGNIIRNTVRNPNPILLHGMLNIKFN